MKHFVRAVALALTLSSACAVAATASPTLPLPPPRESVLAVVGEGLISQAPDEAKISMQIVTDDASASKSVSKNNDIRAALASRMRLPGCSGCDVFHETGYNVEFVPSPPRNAPPDQRPSRTGYVTTRSFDVTIAPIDLAGRAIDAAAAAGVTTIGEVHFDLKNRRAAYMGALSAAMRDARRQAEALASAGSFRIGEVRSVSTDYAPNRDFVPTAAVGMRRAAVFSPAPTDMTPGGPVDVSARATVFYAIK